ncbi:DUF58 domain-containing protein [Chamaesiphon sp. VAR_69_metabat_338]|uniref:DUF58 domain-containing protein n=1 Tax=Chamaesiphon sp. VAR_69_metabat_338 TaxID=2964704 RepID=UPI00286E482C|nr:DUF58 domain-containing protein [Chamaesiphon sp. VAR_69_metabat_338]
MTRFIGFIPSARTLWLLAGGGLAITIIAIFLPAPLGVTLATVLTCAWYLLILGLAGIDAWRSKTDRIQVQREQLGKLSIGRDNLVTLTVQSIASSATSRQFSYQIRDGVPADLAVNNEPISGKLAGGDPQTITYPVHPYRRGEYQWQGIAVRQLGAWGLAWQQWRVDSAQTAVVYPDLVGLKALSIRLTLQSTGSLRQARKRGMGTEFSELRDYNSGDDPRAIDWKATARRNRPLIRVLEPEQEQTVIILLDRGRLMTANIQGYQRFDLGLNATLSLALTAIQRGDRVGVGVFDRYLTTWIPPQQGQNHFSRILDRVSRIEPELLEPDYLGAVTTILKQQSRRALVVVITDIIDEIASAELLTALGRLTPRYLPFCVTLRDPQVDIRAHELAADIPGAFTQAVALDLLHQRELAFANLKRKGVLVLDAPATQISDRLVDRYIQIKSRNQL